MAHEPGVQAFLEEGFDLLNKMELLLLDAEATQSSPELLNALFRTIHTIKGSAGLFVLDDIVAFSHEIENTLELLRNGAIRLDESLTSLLLQCHDQLRLQLQQVQDPQSDCDAQQTSQLITALQRYQNKTPDNASAISQASQPMQSWLFYLGFGPQLFRHGLDPASFLHYLNQQNPVQQTIPLLHRLHDTGFDPEENYLEFALLVNSQRSERELLEIFDFTRDDSILLIAPLNLARQVLNDCDSLNAQQKELVVQAWTTLGMPANDASPKAGRHAPALDNDTRFVRVEAEKLDTLINLVGELVIAGSAGNLLAKQHGANPLLEWSQGNSALIERIRTSTLSMRMVQVGEVFQRFPRIVRELARELDKEIELEIRGSDTELDKSMVEKVTDPIMHIVRNAMDHGIENAEQRTAAGKPAQGQIRLNAYHEAGSIMIEISDDGRGLDLERIQAKAVAAGLLAADLNPSVQELQELIFLPGFTTSKSVSNLSGRGVGMDVVKKSIDALRGSIRIQSQPGHGCTFYIRLPLTLAIIDGFLVDVARTTYVLPLDTVIECLERPEAPDGSPHVNLRNELLPLLDLASHLELAESADNGTRRRNIVVVQANGKKIGLIVDTLLGEFQTVIKPLGQLFNHLRVISGSTILGNGKIALILDVNELANSIICQDNQKYALNFDLTKTEARNN